PRRQAESVFKILRNARVHETTPTALRAAVDHQFPRGSANITCSANSCVFALEVRNSLLDFLHLAPRTDILANFRTQGDSLTEITVSADIGEDAETARIRFIQADKSPYPRPVTCDDGVCVRRQYQSDGTPIIAFISVAPSVPVAERNRLLAFNAAKLVIPKIRSGRGTGLRNCRIVRGAVF